jgi:hypothetical protein
LLLRLSSVVPIWAANTGQAQMAGEILYFLHRHFKVVLILGMIVSLGTLFAAANSVLRLLHMA